MEPTCQKCFGDRPDCYWCDGEGVFPAVDVQDVFDRVTGTPNIYGRRRILKNRPPGTRVDRAAKNPERIRAARAFYVWRMARFHGGADMTLPVDAEQAIHGDPYRDDLDELATAMAEYAWGTAMAGTLRWKELTR